MDVFYQINIHKSREWQLQYENLSLFIIPNDPDGYDDLEVLFLINDDEELFWELDHQDWQRISIGTDVWIGSNSFTMPDETALPGGEYRIILRDLSGDEYEYSFFLKRRSDPALLVFPEVLIRDDHIYVESPYDNNQIWIYTDSEYRSTFSVDKNGLPLATIAEEISGLSDYYYYIYAFNRAVGTGLIHGPFFPQPGISFDLLQEGL